MKWTWIARNNLVGDFKMCYYHILDFRDGLKRFNHRKNGRPDVVELTKYGKVLSMSIYIYNILYTYIYITLLNQLYEQNGDMLGMGIEGGWNGDTIRIRWWYANNFINDMGVPENKGFTPSLWLVKSLLTSRWNGLSNVRWMTNICGIEWTWRKSNLKGFFTTGWMGSLIQLHLLPFFRWQSKEKCRIYLRYLRSAHADDDRCWRNGQSHANKSESFHLGFSAWQNAW